MRSELSLLLALLFTVGCDPKVETRSVEYFMTHVAERDAKRAACKSNPGAARNDDECVNAEQAWVRSAEKADVPKVEFQKKPLR